MADGLRWQLWMTLAALALARTAGAESLDAAEIMRRSFAVGKVRDSRAEITLTLIGESGTQRVRAASSLTKLLPNGTDEARLIRFTAPADIRGTSVLLIEHAGSDDDMWLYLPALRKVRRVIASNKKDSFVGTDFSYGDILGHKVDDWQYAPRGTETVDGVPTYVIDALPRSDRVANDTGYGKRAVWVRTDNFVTIKTETWDRAGNPYKEFRAHDVREIDAASNKWQAFRIEVHDLQTGHTTQLAFTKFEVSVGTSDDTFTTRTLEKEE